MKKLKGVVVSDKMNKTLVVKVTSRKVHPVYKKGISFDKKYLVHENVKANIGDEVEIVETRPVSKRKRWKISKILD